jgi:hypothetical protein
MKDKLIAQQRAVLVEHGLGDQVSGYSGILLMDHKQLAQVCVCVVIPVSK